MPYRQKPNSNRTRMNALRKAQLNVSTETPDRLLLDTPMITLLSEYYDKFVSATDARDRAIKFRIIRIHAMRDCRLEARNMLSDFLNHFLDGMKHGYLDAIEGEYFALEPGQASVSIGDNDYDVARFARLVNAGEKARKQDRLPPMQFPSVEQVEQKVEAYDTAYKSVLTARSDYQKHRDALLALTLEVDPFITRMWNAVEYALQDMTPSNRREKARAYGVKYATRKQVNATNSEVILEESPLSQDDFAPNDDNAEATLE